MSMTSPRCLAISMRSPTSKGRRHTMNAHAARFESGSFKAIAIPAETRPRNVASDWRPWSHSRPMARTPMARVRYAIVLRQRYRDQGLVTRRYTIASTRRSMIQSPTITTSVTSRWVWTAGLRPRRSCNQSRTVAKATGSFTFGPPMEQLHVLRDLAVIFADSLLLILVLYRFKLPALTGFFVAGMLLGPNALGLVSDSHDVESLAEVGVILLLFTIGIEFSLSRLREMRGQILGSGLSQMGFTVLATLAVGLALLRDWRVALFLGFLIALSSTAIVLKVLTDTSEIDAPHGRLATGMLIFQDLCV